MFSAHGTTIEGAVQKKSRTRWNPNASKTLARYIGHDTLKKGRNNSSWQSFKNPWKREHLVDPDVLTRRLLSRCFKIASSLGSQHLVDFKCTFHISLDLRKNLLHDGFGNAGTESEPLFVFLRDCAVEFCCAGFLTS